MRLPVIEGVIDRRILVNFRVDPEVLRGILPAPFRPKIVRGSGIAGICLIRMKEVRPRRFPAALGARSENAAHRIAVEWEGPDGETREGVYIPRRDTSSRLNLLLGGRVFPGVHHHALFDVVEDGERFEVRMRSDDGLARVEVRGRVAPELPAGSVFRSLEEASRFFEGGALGYSPAGRRLDGLELRTREWKVEPLAVEHVRSSFFEALPKGAVAFDCALLMRGVAHEWHAREPLAIR